MIALFCTKVRIFDPVLYTSVHSVPMSALVGLIGTKKNHS